MDKKEFHRQKGEIERSETKDLSAKIITSLIPVGSTAYEAFTALVKPLHKERKDEWLYILMNDLVRREEDGLISLEKLSKNEEFVTIVTKATLLAQQNHQKEKMEALRNVVVNASLEINNTKVDFDKIDFFLILLEKITPLHIYILNFATSCQKYTFSSTIDLSQTIKMHFLKYFIDRYPKLNDKKEVLSVYFNELKNYSLITPKPNQSFLKNEVLEVSLITDLGNQFLKMIETE